LEYRGRDESRRYRADELFPVGYPARRVTHLRFRPGEIQLGRSGSDELLPP